MLRSAQCIRDGSEIAAAPSGVMAGGGRVRSLLGRKLLAPALLKSFPRGNDA